MTPPGFLLICKLTIHLVKQAMMHIILDMQFYPLNRVQSLVQTINLTPLMWLFCAKIHDLFVSQSVMWRPV